jgi:hypothetical protein
MKTKLRLLAVALIAGGTMFAQSRLSIGVGFGGYGPGAYPPPAYAQYQPPCPGPGYSWVDGYWRQPAVTLAPRYVEPRYDNAYRGNDRDDRDRDRGHDNLSQNRGSERRDNHNDNRGNSYSNTFRR